MVKMLLFESQIIPSSFLKVDIGQLFGILKTNSLIHNFQKLITKLFIMLHRVSFKNMKKPVLRKTIKVPYGPGGMIYSGYNHLQEATVDGEKYLTAFYGTQTDHPSHTPEHYVDFNVKIQLEPELLIKNNYGFKSRELVKILKIVEQHYEYIKQKWNETFN